MSKQSASTYYELQKKAIGWFEKQCGVSMKKVIDIIRYNEKSNTKKPTIDPESGSEVS